MAVTPAVRRRPHRKSRLTEGSRVATKLTAAGLLTVVTLMLASCMNDGGQDSLGRDFGLIDAKHRECQNAGHKLARYLDTGRPTNLDPDYGDWRQHVLSLSGEARALAIRQHAAEFIDACDDAVAENRRDERKQRRHERKRAAAAEAAQAAEAERRAALRRYRDACESLGGHVSGHHRYVRIPLFIGPNGKSCAIVYPQMTGSTGTFHIPLDKHGKLREFEYGRQLCAHWKAKGRGDWWHEDTHVCAVSATQQYVIGD